MGSELGCESAPIEKERDLTKNEKEDMLYNGNFLIRSLRHDFSIGDEKHTMAMNVTKDATGK